MKRVIVFSPDTVPLGGALAAGPGIRYFEIASGLKRAGFSVTLAVPADCYTATQSDLELVPWELTAITELIDGQDAVILPQVNSSLSSAYPELAPADTPTAVDLYDPVLIENLGLQGSDDDSVRSFAAYLSGIVPILRRGDFFFCANKRQYYYYLGMLNTLGRINPLTFNESLLKLVPFGLSAEPPVHEKKVMRGTLVGAKDPVILWFSGIYPWFDALTLIRAMPRVIDALPNAKLVVMGGVHPRAHAPDSEYKATLAEAEALGLTGKSVFFVDWRPYSERSNWYLEANVAVTTHKQTLETELSHRTRVIDFIWAGLPTVVSRGDEVGEMIESSGCGIAVKVGDSAELADKLVRILKDDRLQKSMSAAARELAKTLTWDKMLQPLIEWAKNPSLAKDRQSDAARQSVLKAVATLDEHQKMFLAAEKKPGLAGKAINIYRSDGLAATVKKTFDFGARKFKK